MKRKLVLIILSLFCSVQMFSQRDYYTFNSLDGLEDKDGNTQLFYRKYFYSQAESGTSEENSIYRYDVNKNEDTLIAADYWHYNPSTEFYQSISDISFFNNNPFNYIFCGDNGSMESSGFIFKSDSSYRFGVLFLPVNRIEVSKQNPQKVFASIGDGMITSNDSGLTWPTYDWENGFSSSKKFFLLSAFPQDDKIMFGLNNDHLVKSLDTGNTFVEVDTSKWNMQSRFYFDKDNTHIYGSSNGYNGYSFISASDNNGNTFSWKKIWESDRKIFISLDNSLSGVIYLADGKNIFLSVDYGKTFSLFQTLDKSIVGIYKKSGADILYVATKYNLYEITSTGKKILKSYPPSPETLSYYPLKIGNKWIYNVYKIDYYNNSWNEFKGKMTREVIGDTVLSNGNNYFIVKQKDDFRPTEYFYERIDTATGKVFRYDSINDTIREFLIDDLSANPGDTLELYRYHGQNLPEVIYKENNQLFFANQIFDRKVFQIPHTLYYSGYSLTKGIGLDSAYATFDVGYIIYWLKGCIIDGKVLGDTSLVVGVEKENQDLPNAFSLNQNYPNPFNPETVISYELPVNSKVSLTIFDILGNEVASLVDEEQHAGSHKVIFSALTGKNKKLASGIYFYHLQAGNFADTKKFILLK